MAGFTRDRGGIVLPSRGTSRKLGVRLGKPSAISSKPPDDAAHFIYASLERSFQPHWTLPATVPVRSRRAGKGSAANSGPAITGLICSLRWRNKRSITLFYESSPCRQQKDKPRLSRLQRYG